MTDDDELPWMVIPHEAERTVQAALDRLGIRTSVKVPVKVSPYQPIEIRIDAKPLLDAIANEVIAQAGKHGDAIHGFVRVHINGDPSPYRQTVVYKPRRRRSAYRR